MNAHPATVRATKEGIVVGFGDLSRSSPFRTMGDAAGFLALGIWRNRDNYDPDREIDAGPFDWAAFDALVDAECDALRANNGWRLHATAGDYTVWALPGIEAGSPEASDLAFQVTKGEVPSSDGGFRRLDPLLRIKGIDPRDMSVATGEGRDVRAEAGLAGERRVWRGYVRDGSGWTMATDDDGHPRPTRTRTRPGPARWPASNGPVRNLADPGSEPVAGADGMHWILTRPRDARMAELHDLIERTGTPHTVVAGGPVVGSIVPDVSPDGPVICLGSHGLARVAAAKGWAPGAVDVSWFGHRQAVDAWGDRMLNADARFCPFARLADVAAGMGLRRAFVRPEFDDKSFDACVLDVDDLRGWGDTLASPPPADAPSMVSGPKEVLAEWRTWIVDGTVATGSLYRRGGKAIFDGSDLPAGMGAFAADAARDLAEALGGDCPPAYVLDVALVADGYRIVEVNGIAGARLYDCDVNRLFGALDDLGRTFSPASGHPAP